MTVIYQIALPPRVRLVGEIEHADFAEALQMLRSTAQIVTTTDCSTDLIVVAQSRPDAVSRQLVESMRREAPQAVIVSLLGTWCEGEARTGRPWPGVERFYWYEFTAWWRQQLALRAAGRGSDWSNTSEIRPTACTRGLIVLSTSVRSTATALNELLQPAGYATVWRQPGRSVGVVRGATAGLWDGGDLNEREADHLAAFCRDLARDAAPVVALLDFPRADRCERARKLGVAAVLGKPWPNSGLLATIEVLTNHCTRCDDSTSNRAA